MELMAKVGDNKWSSHSGLATAAAFAQREVSLDMLSSASHLTPNSVYRYSDVQGILIYVGITGSRSTRNRQHNGDKEWWPFVVSQTVEHFDSREAAHTREVALIQKYRPPFNKQHNVFHRELKAAYLLARAAGIRIKDTVKDRLDGQGQRFIALSSAIDEQRLCFMSGFDDKQIVNCIRHNANVQIYLNGRAQRDYVGNVSAIEIRNGLLKVVTNVPLRTGRVITRAEGWLRFVTNKPPYILELKRIEAA
jgi:hypothetical protein